jgi:(2Fe-2S) ferredoxin
MIKIKTVVALEVLRKRLQDYRKGFRSSLTLCGGTGCQASDAKDLISAVKNEMVEQGLEQSVLVRVTGCHGFCEQGPIVVVEPGNIFYCHVSPDDAHEIITKTVCKGEVVERLLYTDPVSGQRIQTESEIPFYRAQDRQLLSQNRQIDPCSIEDYIAIGGYSALSKTLSGIEPERIIKEISASGLRGRGGGGFPTGRKWAECSQAPGDEKYVICNADEGDPGAYMDRSILEGNNRSPAGLCLCPK